MVSFIDTIFCVDAQACLSLANHLCFKYQNHISQLVNDKLYMGMNIRKICIKHNNTGIHMRKEDLQTSDAIQ